MLGTVPNRNKGIVIFSSIVHRNSMELLIRTFFLLLKKKFLEKWKFWSPTIFIRGWSVYFGFLWSKWVKNGGYLRF